MIFNHTACRRLASRPAPSAPFNSGGRGQGETVEGRTAAPRFLSRDRGRQTASPRGWRRHRHLHRLHRCCCCCCCYWQPSGMIGILPPLALAAFDLHRKPAAHWCSIRSSCNVPSPLPPLCNVRSEGSPGAAKVTPGVVPCTPGQQEPFFPSFGLYAATGRRIKARWD